MTLTPPDPIMTPSSGFQECGQQNLQAWHGVGWGDHPWAMSELLVCWPFSPTEYLKPQLQPGAPSAPSVNS